MIAGLFSSFYEHCPILNNDDENVKLKPFKTRLTHRKNLKTRFGFTRYKNSGKCVPDISIIGSYKKATSVAFSVGY